MNLAQALRYSNTQSVAFVGAGGKTTALFQLARQLPPPVFVTTTTHMGVWQLPLADNHFVVQTEEAVRSFEKSPPSGVSLFTGLIEGDRARGLPFDVLKWIHEISKRHHVPLLIEADGARQKPLKAPEAHEPPIPDFVDLVIVTAGLSALGKPLTDKWVHRAELFKQLNDLAKNSRVTLRRVAQVLLHPEGGLKNIPSGARRIALLNQADTPELQAKAKQLAGGLLAGYHAVIIASLETLAASVAGPITAVYEPIAGIILAAGESRRFGKPKQLLRWRGKPFIRSIAQTGLSAGLSPVIVVTGANAAQVEASIQDLPLAISRNTDWASGQSSSIKNGIRALPQNTGAALFLLADQPQVTSTVIRALAERHAQSMPAILAPMVEERRANPILFDRSTFDDLLGLMGDIGGRGIFSNHHVDYLPWLDSDLLIDVDTPEDYERLLNRE
jgi:molybdenum cofactor cytidylyltransferase